MGKKSLGSLIKSGVSYVKTYWNKPAKGNYLPVKEWVMYSVGGMGIVGASIIPSFLTMAAGAYIAVALNINVTHIVWIGIVTALFSMATSPLISYMVDNTSTKWGKFRPYLLFMPIPIVVFFIALCWSVPFIKNYWAMLVTYMIFYNLLQFALRLYSLAFTSLLQVISPSMKERTNLMSVGTFFTSLGPSVVQFIYPLVANFIFSYTNDAGKDISGVNTTGALQWVAPICMMAFMALGYVCAFGTKERVVVSKKFKQKTRFIDGVKATAKNKYFWLSNISTVVGVFRMFVATTFVVWICSYVLVPDLQAKGQSGLANSIQALVVTLMGPASIPGMLFAPMLIKKFGKRNMIVASNLITTALTLFAIFFVSQPWVVLAVIFLSTLVNGVQVVTGPAIIAQMYDYQQFKTGDRQEGFISQFGSILTTGFGMLTGFVAPAVYMQYGYVDNGDVLFNTTETLFPIIKMMGWIAIGSGILGTIPMLFWDMSEKKHDQIMEVLKVRAKLEEEECTAEDAAVLEQRIFAGEPNVFVDFFHEDYEEEFAENEGGGEGSSSGESDDGDAVSPDDNGDVGKGGEDTSDMKF